MRPTVRCESCGELNTPSGDVRVCVNCGRPLPPQAPELGDRELTEALSDALWEVARGGEPGRGEVTELVVRGLIARASRPEGYELTSLGLDALREPQQG